LENLRIAGQRLNAFLNPCAARVVHTDAWCSDQLGLVHNFTNFLSISLGKRASKYSEILGKGKCNLAINHALTCDNAISVNFLFVHPKVIAAVRYEGVILDERTTVEEQLDSFTSGQLVALVLLIDPVESPAKQRLCFDVF
jgi:hypothetical protein